MAKKKNKNSEEVIRKDAEKSKKKILDLHPEARRSVWGVVLLAVALVMLLGAFSSAGQVGNFAYDVLHAVLGMGFYLIPFILILIAVLFFTSQDEHNLYQSSLIGGSMLFLSALGILHLCNISAQYGGYVGWAVATPFIYFFGMTAAVIILVTIALVSFIIIFNISIAAWWNKFRSAVPQRAAEEEITVNGAQEESPIKEEVVAEEETEEAESEPAKPSSSKKEEGAGKASRAKKLYASFASDYPLPPLTLLEEDSDTPSSGDIKAYANIIKRTLETFGIPVEMAEINIGPTVTQYTLKPAQGVKLSKITALQNDLALALAAHPIRIEAPIPGRSLVGIEIPNKSVATVRIRNLLSEKAFFEHASPLLMALGRDVTGSAMYADLAKMPHLLVAGATGSGKSITIHTILTSLLYRNSPRTLRLLIIDPKRVEMAYYNNIPHLLAPVVVEREKAIYSLRWAVKEMERRYEVLAEAGSRDIQSYNSQMVNSGESASVMPYIVVVVDELADLMVSFPREVEGSIVRLAQMSRAVGIHIIISTQRPSVEIITGLIKANITSRIALQVATQIDSRTIIDMSGAEKLLGHGDMLYLAGDISKPRRIQGAFISEHEIKKVAQYWKDAAAKLSNEGGDQINFEENLSQGGIDFAEGGDMDDELFEDARDVVIKSGKASTSLLQRRLRIGYSRAARLIDLLEEKGVVGPGEGAKPRRVLVGNEEGFGGVETKPQENEGGEDDYGL